jgi:hypothetical protein
VKAWRSGSLLYRGRPASAQQRIGDDMHLIHPTTRCLLATAYFSVILAPAFAAEKFRKFKEHEIRARLAGMEITDEAHWAELYNRNGTFTSWSMGKKSTGKWHVRGGELCLDDGKSPAECKEVWMSGNKVEFRRTEGGFAIEGVLKTQQPRT